MIDIPAIAAIAEGRHSLNVILRQCAGDPTFRPKERRHRHPKAITTKFMTGAECIGGAIVGGGTFAKRLWRLQHRYHVGRAEPSYNGMVLARDLRQRLLIACRVMGLQHQGESPITSSSDRKQGARGYGASHRQRPQSRDLAREARQRIAFSGERRCLRRQSYAGQASRS